jgi:uncharacterized protein YecA (UPF0149 family)
LVERTVWDRKVAGSSPVTPIHQFKSSIREIPMELGRNEPCHCGSGKKYKKCHIEKDETENRKAREKAALNAAKVAAAHAEAEPEKKDNAAAKHPDKQGGFFTKVAGRMGFARGQQRRAPPQAQKKGGS